MPSRRTTLIGLGALVAGGTGAVATGAFSAATAERDVTVEFEDDADAILGFESTSEYAAGDDEGMISLTFDNLNENTDFTFQDTFRIVNNGSETVRFDRVQSAEPGEEDTSNWNYNDENSPAHILVADEKNAWQGSEESIDDDVVDEDDDTNVGRTPARDALDGSSGPELEPGEWISIGFGFWGVEDLNDNGSTVGEWGPDDIPGELQINFGG